MEDSNNRKCQPYRVIQPLTNRPPSYIKETGPAVVMVTNPLIDRYILDLFLTITHVQSARFASKQLNIGCNVATFFSRLAAL